MLEQGVQLALDQMQYASSIISRVREFTQSRQPRNEPVNLHTLLDGSLTLLDWELKRYAIELRIQLHHQNAQVQGDGVMLQQVLVNLLRNAIDAMQETPAGQRRLQISSRMDESAGMWKLPSLILAAVWAMKQLLVCSCLLLHQAHRAGHWPEHFAAA